MLLIRLGRLGGTNLLSLNLQIKRAPYLGLNRKVQKAKREIAIHCTEKHQLVLAKDPHTAKVYIKIAEESCLTESISLEK